MNALVVIKENSFWEKYTFYGMILWFKGYLYGKSIDQLAYDFQNIDRSEINEYLSNLDGNFAFVIERGDLVLAAVDKICSTPLFFTKIGKIWTIDSHAPSLITKAQIKGNKS